jgi:hypothetical protein
MMNILKEQNGMNIVGQGEKIILFTLPSLRGLSDTGTFFTIANIFIFGATFKSSLRSGRE